MESVKVFSPASVANVGCGYDIFGFALEHIGDEILLTKRADSELRIINIEGANLPMAPEKNVATVAIQSLLKAVNSNQGFDISIKKNVNPGSGLGSSASSAAGAVFAANALLKNPLDKHQLINHAMQGEAIASSQPHADNVAPAMLGGFTVVRSCTAEKADVFQIPYPDQLRVLTIFPQVEVKTAEAKQLLGDTVSLANARTQWGNVAGMVAGLANGDWELIGKSLHDVIAEPLRKKLIPAYDQIRDLVLASGAIGFNISGSGPTMFAFYNGEWDLTSLSAQIKAVYEEMSIEVFVQHNRINPTGTQIV